MPHRWPVVYQRVQMRNSKLTPVILLLPLMAVTLTVIIACVNVLLQSIGYVPAFGLTKITLGYYREVFQTAGISQRTMGEPENSLCFDAAGGGAWGTLLCTALVKRRAGGGMLYTVRFPILVPHTVVALFIMTLLGQTGIVARAAYGLGLISDYTKFPQILFTPGYGGAIAGYLWKEIPFVAYYTLALMASVSRYVLGRRRKTLAHRP